MTKKTITGPTIYVGPTLDNFPLKQYTSFENGIVPAHLTSKIEQHPEIKTFIVDPAEISKIEAKIADKTTIQAMHFAKIATLNKG